jgi:2-isopropylmalate synthase
MATAKKPKGSTKTRITVFDTTLRDAEQSPGGRMTTAEKILVAHQLALLGVDVIEAGFPQSSPGDLEAVQRIVREVKGPTIAALARCRPEDIDSAALALKGGKRVRLHAFIGTSPQHREGIMRKTREQVLEMAISSVSRARQLTAEVEFSAMDATRTEFDYLCQIVEETIRAGATIINLPDTVGYSMPWEFGEMIRRVRETVPNIDQAIISVHCHDDLGLATANSLAAVVNGARQVECTINGLGERAGNAALEEVACILDTRRELKRKYATGIVLKEIFRTSRLVRDITGMPVQANKAIVGANAFAHASGIHQDGVLKQRNTFEIITPQKIGREKTEIVLTSRSGRHGVSHRLEELGYKLSPEEMAKTYQRFLEVADQRKQVTDEELMSLVEDETRVGPESYQLDYMHVVSGGTTIPTATVRLRRDDESQQAVSSGVGSVDAVYRAIDQIMQAPHQLVDYTVNSIAGGTDALGEVTVRISDASGMIYTGRGSSMDIIEASARAYLTAMNKLALRTTGAGRTARRAAKKRKVQ